MPRPRLTATSAAITLAVLVLLVSGGTAYAVWGANGTGQGTTQAATLVAPTVSAAPTTGSTSSSVTLSWTAPSQLPGATYSVTRNGTTVSGCTTSPCTDGGLAAGTTYTYVVTATLSGWTATGSAAATTTSAAATRLAVSAPASVAAGANATVTITAQTATGATDTTFSGSKPLSWSGGATATSVWGYAAVLPTSATFSAGRASVTVSLRTAGTALPLGVASGALSGSTTTTVTAGAADRLGFTSVTYPGSSSPECRASCSVPSNKGSITFKVSVLDTYGNLTTAPAAINAKINVGSYGTQATLSIAKNGTESTAYSGNPSGISATVTIDGGPGYLAADNATISLAPQ